MHSRITLCKGEKAKEAGRKLKQETEHALPRKTVKSMMKWREILLPYSASVIKLSDSVYDRHKSAPLSVGAFYYCDKPAWFAFASDTRLSNMLTMQTCYNECKILVARRRQDGWRTARKAAWCRHSKGSRNIQYFGTGKQGVHAISALCLVRLRSPLVLVQYCVFLVQLAQSPSLTLTRLAFPEDVYTSRILTSEHIFKSSSGVWKQAIWHL